MAALIACAKYRGEFEDTLRLFSKKLQILMGTAFFSLMRFTQLFEQVYLFKVRSPDMAKCDHPTTLQHTKVGIRRSASSQVLHRFLHSKEKQQRNAMDDSDSLDEISESCRSFVAPLDDTSLLCRTKLPVDSMWRLIVQSATDLLFQEIKKRFRPETISFCTNFECSWSLCCN